jgi:hypothetical protein
MRWSQLILVEKAAECRSERYSMQVVTPIPPSGAITNLEGALGFLKLNGVWDWKVMPDVSGEFQRATCNGSRLKTIMLAISAVFSSH